ncbi:cutinase, partial [Mycobacterium tuberculosis]
MPAYRPPDAKALDTPCEKGPLCLSVGVVCAVNRPGMSGDSSSWKGWGHVRWFIEEV